MPEKLIPKSALNVLGWMGSYGYMSIILCPVPVPHPVDGTTLCGVELAHCDRCKNQHICHIHGSDAPAELIGVTCRK